MDATPTVEQVDDVEPRPACGKCGQPATCSLGTVWLCARCKWELQAEILARRPDLRADDIGRGQPVSGAHANGWHDLACDLCGATWPGPIGERCSWCQQRHEHQQDLQQRMDRQRFRELLARLRDGDMAALPAAIDLARRLGSARQLANVLAYGAKR